MDNPENWEDEDEDQPSGKVTFQMDELRDAVASAFPRVPSLGKDGFLDKYSEARSLNITTDGGMSRPVSARDLARHTSYEHPSSPKKKQTLLADSPRDEKDLPISKVMVLYTGGTIGMKTHGGVYHPEHNYLPQAIRKIPHLNDAEYVEENYAGADMKPMCLPPVKNTDKRVVYWVAEYHPLLDSSDITFDDWIRIGKDIEKSYDEYDGFVVLHGTDTLAYTASALSFMLGNLGKPVIITGAQIPVAEVRSDGRENLIGALIMAGNFDIPEVTVYFNSKLFRGNRTSKVDNSALDAFNSPNMEPLAHLEITIKVNTEAIFRSANPERLTLRTNFERRIGLLRIVPSMSIDSVRGCLQGVKGLVLQTFGAGNMPTKRTDIIQVLKEAIESGIIIVNCSQCIRGKVDTHYYTGKILYDIGVISGSDMTTEAAITKLAFILGRTDMDHDRKIKLMSRNIRGELTTPIKQEGTLQDLQILRRLARFLRLGTNEEVEVLREALFPPLLLTAAGKGDIELLENLWHSGASLSSLDYDKRSALHVAAAAGEFKAAEYLVRKGVSVHLRDHAGHTPLHNAIRQGHLDIVKLLRDVGASVNANPMSLGVDLCMTASVGNLAQMKAWHAAGVDFNCADYDGRTPLHVASSWGYKELAEFLAHNGADPTKKDGFGRTSIEEAQSKGHEELAEMLRESLPKTPNPKN